MNVSEKVAYITGLADGMKLDSETNEGKMLLAMLDVLKDIAIELEGIDSNLDDVADILCDIEDDLGTLEETVEELEEELYGEDDYDDFDYDGDDDLYEITCCKCGNTVAIDMSMLEDSEISCPNCGEKIEFDIDFAGNGCEGCDCGCNDE